MTSLVFDIETNGLLDTLTQLHCIVTYDLDTDKISKYSGASLSTGIQALQDADELIGHNILAFDIPAIEKIEPTFNFIGTIVDTLVISRLIYTTLGDRDALYSHRQLKRNKPPLPRRLVGSHGLEAWGHRLGYHKGDYAKECETKGIDPWAEFNESMLEYCVNDVQLNTYLYSKLRAKNYSEQAIKIEHEVHSLCLKQTARGVAFDVRHATEFYGLLSGKREVLKTKLIEVFGSWVAKDKEFTPKRSNKLMGYTEGCTLTKVKVVEFNPSSTQHIANRLQKLYGWKPKVFTPSGLPKVDESVLKGLKYPEIPLLLEYLLVNKRISQLAEGRSAWLLLEDNGRIHGRVNTMGTISGRASHNSPNLGQVVSVNSPYGVECRQCFTATPGMKFVGADASGLELRCLAHYMARWDSGAYSNEVLNGDIHTANQKAAGLPTRNQAKTFIYGLLYGAGNKKIGEIINKGAKAGGQLRNKFMTNLPAYKHLSERVKAAAESKGYLKGLDGRQLIIRSIHSALNQLLQGAGAVIMKQAMINYHELLRQQNIIHGKDYHQVLFVHDEFQVECKPEYAEIVGQAMVDGIRKVTQDFNLKCPLDGEYKIGLNWAETH